jgi:DNA invertase Pin-like site-specific DNA recombinase
MIAKPLHPNAPLRVALYARVSTSNHGQDVGLQLEELRQLAQQRGWTIVGEFVDEGVSGTTTSRPALDAMLDAARRGKLDLIVTWKLDRLGRSLQHLLQVLDDLSGLRVGFVAARDAGIDTTSPQGRLLLQLLGAFAEFERAMIRERVIAGVCRAQAAGTHCGRPRRELDLRAAKLLLQQGQSVRHVAEMLAIPRGTLIRRLADDANQGGSKVTRPTDA